MDTVWSALIIDDDPGVRQSVRLCLEVDSVFRWRVRRISISFALRSRMLILYHARAGASTPEKVLELP